MGGSVNFKFKRNIQRFPPRAPLRRTQYQSSENFTCFESTKVTYNKLLEALQDDGIYMIGVYGMGGSGKTTLVFEAAKKAEELNLFDIVLPIRVSQTPNIKAIQDEMADMLGLKLEDASEAGRARCLWLGLNENKRILIIVDDLWTKFNLEDIGIRLNNDYKIKWKVLITTRRDQVCDSMGCQKKIHLTLLSENESWTLFQKSAKIDEVFSKSLDDIPRKICSECQGLPIAIITVGSCLKGKSNVVWKETLHMVRRSETIDDPVEERARDAFSALKLSYDYLQNKEAKLLFLMCSMFPEDYNISIEDLIRYAVGVGMGGTFLLEARDMIRENINKLVQSCLLMQVEDGNEFVKMHDLVRDAALWIAKRSDNYKILVNIDKPLSALAEDDTIRGCFAVSSWDNENQIFCQLHAPNLEILLLNKKIKHPLDLSDVTFEGIQGLKVFSVINYDYIRTRLSLPQSTQLLTNLRTLRLNNWQLGDISFIASLTRLEVLDLQDCSFKEIPNEIGKLERLKLLDMSKCDIRENYNGAIEKCSQLEELYFSGLVLRKYHCQSIVDIVTLPKLHRFVINTTEINIPHYAEMTRVLAVVDFNISILMGSKENLLQVAEAVHLLCLHGGCKNVIPDVVAVVGAMNGLTILFLKDCVEIECIFDATSDFKVYALVPKLVKLELQGMENLKELCRGPPLQVLHFFEKLEELQIWDCPQLHSIFPWECNLRNLKILTIYNHHSDGHSCTSGEVLFSTSIAQSLQQLEKLIIKGCHELKHIIASDREHGSNTSEEIVPTLGSSHFVMPNLKYVHIGECMKLESIFQIFCVEVQIKLPHLESLTLIALENLIRICPENYDVEWPSLRKLEVLNCPKLDKSTCPQHRNDCSYKVYLN